MFIGQFLIRSLLVILLVLFSGNIYAVNVQQFSRSNSLTFEMIEDARLSSSHVMNHYKWLYNLGTSYVDQPLVIKNSKNTQQLDEIIDSMMSLHFGAAYYVKPYWQIAANTTFSFFEDNNGNDINEFQDLNLKSKFRLHSSRRNAFTVMPIASIPLGGGKTLIQDNSTPQNTFGTDYLLSDKGLGLGLFFIYEHLFNTFQVSLNLGYKYNDKAKFVDDVGRTQIDKTQVLTAGLGLYYPFHKKMGLNIEYISNYTAPFFNKNLNPNELFIGLSGGIKTNIHGFVGAGFGNIIDSSDGNDFRIVTGLKFTPGATARKNYKEKTTNKLIRIIKDSRLFCQGAYLFDNTNSIVLLFKNDSDQISNEQIQKLNEALVVYRERQKDIIGIEIHGHTSRKGSKSYNLNLGTRRANKIKKILADAGVEVSKITNINSFGEELLLDSSEAKSASVVNRRVELNFRLNDKFKDCYYDK